jgi:hypothetical protein
MLLTGQDDPRGQCEALRTELELSIIRAGIVGPDFECILDAADALIAAAIQEILGAPDDWPFSSP